MNVRLMSDLDLQGKTVVFREDLNVPVKEGKITSDKRIRAAIPSLRFALDKGAGIIVLSHLGRPEEGVYSEEASLAPVAKRLEELLGDGHRRFGVANGDGQIQTRQEAGQPHKIPRQKIT